MFFFEIYFIGIKNRCAVIHHIWACLEYAFPINFHIVRFLTTYNH